MKVILKQKVQSLGHAWDVVEVKNGYARNYLFPQNLAEMATPGLLKRAEKQSADRTKKMEEILANAQGVAKKMAGITLTFKEKAKGEKLYGSIAEKDIAEALTKEHKLEVSKDMVKMDEHIKTVGSHAVKIHLTEKTDVEIKVVVEAE